MHINSLIRVAIYLPSILRVKFLRNSSCVWTTQNPYIAMTCAVTQAVVLLPTARVTLSSKDFLINKPEMAHATITTLNWEDRRGIGFSATALSAGAVSQTYVRCWTITMPANQYPKSHGNLNIMSMGSECEYGDNVCRLICQFIDFHPLFSLPPLILTEKYVTAHLGETGKKHYISAPTPSTTSLLIRHHPTTSHPTFPNLLTHHGSHWFTANTFNRQYNVPLYPDKFLNL